MSEKTTSDDLASALRKFAIEVAEKWGVASPAALEAMVEVAKLDAQSDNLNAAFEKLAELDRM